jgi:hypothetical protein
MSLTWLMVMNLLSRDASKLTVEIDTCDSYGQSDLAECKRSIDASPVQAALAMVKTKPTKAEPNYCVDYGKPIVGSATTAPIVGFKCWQHREYSDSSVELLCDQAFCTVTALTSNEDEDHHITYSFRLTGTGKTLAVDGNAIHVSLRSNN